MDDPKLESAKLNYSAFPELRVIPVGKLNDVGRGYAVNMMNVRSAIDGIIAIVALVLRYEGPAIEACFEMTGQVRISDQEATVPEFKAEHNRLIREKVAKAVEELNRSSNPKSEDQRALKAVGFVLREYPEVADELNPHHLHIDGIFRSMIVGAWTAFEVMAGDLWEAAYNTWPVPLSAGNKAKQLDIGKLIMYLNRNDYNLSGVMGTMLRETDKYAFDSLPKIRNAYNEVFGPIPALLSTDLEALAQMRHSFVHQAGNVCKEFLDAARNNPRLSKWKELDIGSKILVDGADVKALIEPVIRSGVDLILFVHNWSIKNVQVNEANNMSFDVKN